SILDLVSFAALRLQRIVGPLQLLYCFCQEIARAPERFCGAPLRSAQRCGDCARHGKNDKARYLCGLYGERIQRWQEVIIERETAENDRKQSGPDSTQPPTNHNCAEKQRRRSRAQVRRRPPC